MRPKRWRWPLAGATAAAVVGTALIQFAPPLRTTAFAQESAGQTQGIVSFADVVERASPAVVNISVPKIERAVSTRAFPGFEGLPRGIPGSPLEEFFGRFFEMPDGQRGMPGEPRRSEGAGSGFVI